jgi:hypothetical protein
MSHLRQVVVWANIHMRIKLLLLIFLATVLLFLVLTRVPCFAGDEDPCKDQGITVRNLSFKEIWYKQKDGDCTILKRNYSFNIKPNDEIRLFSDMVCETPYCPACKYSDYKAYDANNDCRVKILPVNALADI